MSLCWFIYLLVGIALSIPTLYLIWRYSQGGQFTKKVRIDGKVVIVTGANSGIGVETAHDLAKRGARVYLACRNVAAAQTVCNRIIVETGNANVFVLKLDLGSLETVRDFVRAFHEREDRLDVLINNAGVMAVPTRELTTDGHEMQFGTNHLGHFLLTNLLLDKMKASTPSRIINVSSNGHYYGRLQRDNLNSELSYGPWAAYTQSKLANVLFTRELAKRLRGTGVTANSLHPGGVRTELQRNYPILRVFVTPLAYLLLKSPRSGAQTTLALAVDPDLETVSGKYFTDCRVKTEAKRAKDDESAEWLWEKSDGFVGLSK